MKRKKKEHRRWESASTDYRYRVTSNVDFRIRVHLLKLLEMLKLLGVRDCRRDRCANDTGTHRVRVINMTPGSYREFVKVSPALREFPWLSDGGLAIFRRQHWLVVTPRNASIFRFFVSYLSCSICILAVMTPVEKLVVFRCKCKL